MWFSKEMSCSNHSRGYFDQKKNFKKKFQRNGAILGLSAQKALEILKKTFFKMPLKICKGPPFFTFLTFFLKLDIKSQGEICMNFFRKIVGSPYEKWKKDSLEHSKMHIGSFFKNFYTFWNASYLVLEIENFEKSSPFFIWIFL